VAKVDLKAQVRAAQARQLGQQLAGRRHHDAYAEAGHIQPACQQQHGQDHTQIVGRRAHGGIDEALPRVMVGLQDARQSVESRGHDQPHQQDGSVQQLRVVFEPRQQDHSHLRGKDLQQGHHGHHHHRHQAEQHREDTLQLFLAAGDGILTQHRHQCGAQQHPTSNS
jgi:hypothetical protein